MLNKPLQSLHSSIKAQLIASAVAAVVLLSLALVAANNWLLPKYYESEKTKDLVRFYNELSDLESNGALTKIELNQSFDDEDKKIELRDMIEKDNLEFTILNSSNEPVIYSTREGEILRNQLMSYLLRRDNDSKTVISTDDYTIVKSDDKGPAAERQHLDMWGNLGENYSFLVRTPVESLRYAADISNQFMVRIGILILILAVLLAWLLANRISQPIRQLAELSTRMSNLDFTARYTGTEENEIGTLGKSFNQMSDELEKNISDLKNANYKLQKDLDMRLKQEETHREFIGNIAHELKTPIAVIQGYAEGLKEGVASDEESRRDYCEVIADEAERMTQIIHNMMLLDQLENSSEQNDFERFNLNEVIQGLLASMELIIGQKEADVTFIANRDVYVWADEYMVEQVLSNYLNNALNHLDQNKKIEIRITTHDDIAHVSVFNSGAPIPEESMERIWDKFYKVDKARSREYGGHGIGLSIVKAIMDSFHQKYGAINYENGVEFWFELAMK